MFVRLRTVVLPALLLAVAACGTLGPQGGGRSDLPLVQLPSGRDQVDLVMDRAACRQEGRASRACQTRDGYGPLTKAGGEAFLASVGDGAVPMPLSVAVYRVDDGALFTGFTELFPRGDTSPIILDRANKRQCDGVARLVRQETLAEAPVGDALLGCGDGAILSLRLALDTPTSGHGVGWDDRGRQYRVLFGAAGVSAMDADMARALRLIPDVQSPLAGVGPESRAEGFSLRQVRSRNASVPRIYGQTLAEPVGLRKTAFLRRLLPVVVASNELIRAERAHMIGLLERRADGVTLTDTNEAWLRRLAKRYDADWQDNPTLRYRVDAVPPSLALAQAALETGWGQSRFAQHGNALFGEWTFGDRRGIVPAGRGAGETHKIRSFDTLMQSVMSYMDNLNSNQAYRELRAERARLRALGQRANGLDLAQHLEHYAGDGAYIPKLRRIIRANAFTAYDDAVLASAPIGRIAQPLPKPFGGIQLAGGQGFDPAAGLSRWVKRLVGEADLND